MNYDDFKVHWQDWRDSVGRYFSKLTQEDVAKIDGNYETLVQLLQKRYGYPKERAQDEFDGFFAEIGKTIPSPGTTP